MSTRADRCLVGFGCGGNAGLMVGAQEGHRRAVVGAALEAGIDFFDTAPVYGDGVSEGNLGRVLSAFGADIDVYTKVSLTPADLGDVKGSVIRSVETSLSRIQRSRVAGVTLHNRVAARRDPSRHVGAGPLLSVDDVLGPGGVTAALRELSSAGTVGSIGFTTLGGEAGAIDELLASRQFDYVNAIYGILGPLDRGMPAIEGAVTDVVTSAAAHGHDVVALRVFGGGLLFDPAADQEPYVHSLERWCGERATELAQTALRFAMSNPHVTAIVLGFTEVQHLADAMRAVAAGPLAPEELEEISRLRLVAQHR